jgi:hypothetical protein
VNAISSGAFNFASFASTLTNNPSADINLPEMPPVEIKDTPQSSNRKKQSQSKGNENNAERTASRNKTSNISKKPENPSSTPGRFRSSLSQSATSGSSPNTSGLLSRFAAGPPSSDAVGFVFPTPARRGGRMHGFLSRGDNSRIAAK